MVRLTLKLANTLTGTKVVERFVIIRINLLLMDINNRLGYTSSE
jgi:hypothetical protein